MISVDLKSSTACRKYHISFCNSEEYDTLPLREKLGDSSVAAAKAAPDLTRLGNEWMLIANAQLNDRSIDLVLLHSRFGVALLQSPQEWSLDLSSQLRQRLDQARFSAIFPGYLPIVHRALPSKDITDLPRFLMEDFAAQPPLNLPAGDAWVMVVRRILEASSDNSWRTNLQNSSRRRQKNRRIAHVIFYNIKRGLSALVQNISIFFDRKILLGMGKFIFFDFDRSNMPTYSLKIKSVDQRIECTNEKLKNSIRVSMVNIINKRALK